MIETGVNCANRVLAFEYDDQYQLTREADSLRNSGSPVVYAYDAMGNRTRKVDNGITTDYTVDKLNRVTAATTGVNVISYTYDANGNTVSKTAAGVTRTYHYDRDNRLIRVSEGEGDEEIFTAVYDYRSRRLEKTENGDTVSYLYDGGVSVQEYDAEGSLKTYLVRAGGYGGGIGDVVYTENADGTGREYFLYNATGTTSALTDDDGAVTSTSCYTAWGIETATVGTSENVRKFSTKERSEQLGIDYFGFRCYDPDLGRFLTRDPSGYPDGPNNYIYCINNPVCEIDPLGLMTDEQLLRQWQEGRARQHAREMEGVTIHESGERNFMDYAKAPANFLLTGNAFPSHKESAQAYNTVVDDYKTGNMNKRGAEMAFATAELAGASAEMSLGITMTVGTFGMGTAGGVFLAGDGASRGSGALSRMRNTLWGGNQISDPMGDAFNAVFGEENGSGYRDALAGSVALAPSINQLAVQYYSRVNVQASAYVDLTDDVGRQHILYGESHLS